MIFPNQSSAYDGDYEDSYGSGYGSRYGSGYGGGHGGGYGSRDLREQDPVIEEVSVYSNGYILVGYMWL